LRSPITRLQSVIERAAVSAKDAGARAALESAQQEAEGLQAMLTAALQITRAEAGIGRDRFTPVDLAAVLDDLVEIYGPAAEDGGFVLTAQSEGDVVLPVHRELLGQALGNLVENALRHADGGSRVSLEVSREREAIVISVADDGQGIPPERHEEALRRFGRLDHSRHAGGHGLGLALVEATARLHGGGIELGDAHPGLVVRLVLPVIR
jgi:signal transduction histidine kinase